MGHISEIKYYQKFENGWYYVVKEFKVNLNSGNSIINIDLIAKFDNKEDAIKFIVNIK